MAADRSKRIHIAITAAVMLLIFIHSAMPGDLSGAESGFFVRLIAALTGLDPVPLVPVVRKLAHFTEFAVLGACLMVNVNGRVRSSAPEHAPAPLKGASGADRGAIPVPLKRAAGADRGASPAPLKRQWAAAWVLATLYAVTDELHQYFVPDRACAFTDVCIDSAGAAMGALIAAAVIAGRAQRSRASTGGNSG